MPTDMNGVTIGQLLERAVEKFGDREALVFEDLRITFRELAEETDLWARAFMAAGVEPGDKVSLMMANRPEWVLIHLALAQIGAALVPVNTGFRMDEVGYVVGQSDSVLFIVGPEVRGRSLANEGVDILQDDRVSARSLVVVGCEAPDGTVAADEFLAGAGDVSADQLEARKAAANYDDVVLILYTSGTTGFPKGAMHSHKVIRNMADAADRMQLTPDDAVVLYLPLYHVFGAAAVVTYLYSGGTIVLLEDYDVAESLGLMEREKATIVYGISTMYYDQMQHEDFDRHDLSSVRLCVVPGTADLVRATSEKLGPAVNVYGMTESTSMTTLCSLDDTMDNRAETVGKPLPGFEVKVIGPDGTDAQPGVVGELVVRGHPVMLGYYKKPDATAEVLDSDGWFHTGDAAILTQDGYVRYAGRIKEILRVGGENVDPIEVETVLMRHPAVAMAALVGVPDERLGEVGAAYVQLLRGETVTPEELREYVKERLARFKVPRHVLLVEEFPKTGSGKIQKFRLGDQFRKQTEMDA